VHDLLQTLGLGQELRTFPTCADQTRVQYFERHAPWPPGRVVDNAAAAFSENRVDAELAKTRGLLRWIHGRVTSP
jgi:hypothetical protein